jgi:hypothetical protein
MPTIIQETKIKSPPVSEKKIPLMQWFYMKEQEVLNTFAALPNAVKVGSGDEQFVYIPGTREDKVLLVAHADTVGGDSKINVKFQNGRYYSAGKRCLGADDRAGCAILWNLRDSGHSLLIPNAEESGCKGTRFLMKDDTWSKKINDEHRFAIEFDRMNSSDLVFYDVGSGPFRKWCEENFKGYKTAQGSFTDICYLCDKICGLNISVGYYGQHNNTEILVEKEWHRTLLRAREVLAQKNLPRFEQPKRPPVQPFSTGRTLWDSSMLPVSSRSIGTTPLVQPVIVANYDWLMVCPHCKGLMDDSEYKQNHEQCLYCKEKF